MQTIVTNGNVPITKIDTIVTMIVTAIVIEEMIDTLVDTNDDGMIIVQRNPRHVTNITIDLEVQIVNGQIIPIRRKMTHPVLRNVVLHQSEKMTIIVKRKTHAGSTINVPRRQQNMINIHVNNHHLIMITGIAQKHRHKFQLLERIRIHVRQILTIKNLDRVNHHLLVMIIIVVVRKRHHPHLKLTNNQ